MLTNWRSVSQVSTPAQSLTHDPVLYTKTQAHIKSLYIKCNVFSVTSSAYSNKRLTPPCQAPTLLESYNLPNSSQLHPFIFYFLFSYIVFSQMRIFLWIILRKAIFMMFRRKAFITVIIYDEWGGASSHFNFSQLGGSGYLFYFQPRSLISTCPPSMALLQSGTCFCNVITYDEFGFTAVVYCLPITCFQWLSRTPRQIFAYHWRNWNVNHVYK